VRKALIRVGTACNNRCVFCHTAGRGPVAAEAALVEWKIVRARELGHDLVVFSGGEPTLRPELRRWARLAHDQGLAVGLVTNGRMLAYPELVRDLGLAYAQVSLHGDQRVHDALVRDAAFEQTRAGIENLLGGGTAVTVACVVTRQNLSVLGEVTSLEDVAVKFAFPEPKGRVAAHFEDVVPPIADAANAIRAAEGPRVGHEGVPLCLLPGLEDRVQSLRTHGFVSASEPDEPDFFPIDTEQQTYPEACEDCALVGRCPGIFRGYLARRQDFVPRPVTGVRANSYNYRPVRRLGWSESCPIRASGVSPYHRSRALFLRDGESMTQHETATQDFSDAEIEAAKLGASQIYLDVGDGLAPEDFSRDLRQLSRLADCRACPEDARCAGCYRPTDVDVFTRDEVWLRSRLAELCGDVLELGAGAGRHLAWMDPTRVRYLGVDPDAAALTRLRDAFPWARTLAKRAEDLVPDPIDHALILHAYNHLERPVEVLARLARALRPGGTLLLADDVAFGLVRGAARADRAEAGPARRQHFRNHSAKDVLARLGDLPLAVVALRDVGPERSNQWVLELRREASA
jgi:pyruvate-formate lyase-activating enzyme/SAM-dependent methyltransferase